MSEIWCASGGGKDWDRESTPSIFGIWWALWLISHLVGRIAFRMSMNAEEMRELQNANLATTGSDLVSIFLTLAFMQVVQEIADRKPVQTAGPQALENPEPERAEIG